MRTKRQPTEAQKQAARERRERIKGLAKQIAALTPAERIRLAGRAGIRTVQGHELSVNNQVLLLYQMDSVSFVGGYNQWRTVGRYVTKGARGLSIWIPIAKGKRQELPDGERDADGADGVFFTLATVFDVSQTVTIGDESADLGAPLLEMAGVA